MYYVLLLVAIIITTTTTTSTPFPMTCRLHYTLHKIHWEQPVRLNSCMKKKVSPSEGKLQENARKKLNRPVEELRESSKTTASDQEHVMIKDLFFDVISYCNIRNFLWHACLLACVYYLGIGMYRSQNRAITKHNMEEENG